MNCTHTFYGRHYGNKLDHLSCLVFYPGEMARNVGQPGQILGYLTMETSLASGQGDAKIQGYNPIKKNNYLDVALPQCECRSKIMARSLWVTR